MRVLVGLWLCAWFGCAVGCAQSTAIDEPVHKPKARAHDAGVRTATAAAQDAGQSLPTPGGDAGDVIAEPEDDAQPLFDQKVIRTYELTVDPADLASIDQDPAAETYVAGTLSFEGESQAVGVRYKGSVGGFLAPCTASTFPGLPTGAKTGKCSIKVAFDYADDSGRFHGLKKLNFHSMGRDPSMMRERLGYMLYRQVGVASPRTMHARLVINGKLEGLFVVVEQIDGRFTRARFSEGGKGNLYKEVWPEGEDETVYRTALASNKGSETDVDAMLAFKRAIDQGGDAAAPWLDRGYMLHYIAVDRLILNDDGVFHFYCDGTAPIIPGVPGSYNHNYYWYQAEAAGRFWLVPWDLDGSFALDTRVHIDPDWRAQASCQCHISLGFPELPATCDPLSAELASWSDDYDRTVDELLNGPYSKTSVDQALDTWSAQISDAVDETAGLNGAPDRATWQSELSKLRDTIATTREHRGFPY